MRLGRAFEVTLLQVPVGCLLRSNVLWLPNRAKHMECAQLPLWEEVGAPVVT